MDTIKPAADFRTFLQELERRADLVTITEETSLHLEIAAITRRVYEKRLPATLFNNISEAMPGARVLGAPAGMLQAPDHAYSRLALHFDLPETARPSEIIGKILSVKNQEGIKPEKVESGPVKQNIWTGMDIDITRLPAPLLHEKDGGRYLGTYGFHVVQSPDGKWHSWGIGRLMVAGKHSLTGPAIPTQHIGIIREMWRKHGKPTPWAFVLGAPPAAVAVAGMPLPAFVDEQDYVGALLGEPLKLVETETNGLLVPANAEIVIEGEISLDEMTTEGPMGEYHGYQHTHGGKQPVFNVHAVTFRDDPILPICVAGLPVEENHTIWGTMISAQVLESLQAANLPVDMAWCSYEATSCWTVISVDTDRLAELKTSAREFADRVAEVYFNTHAGYLVPKLIMVGNDIDITKIDEVAWVLATRAHPLHDFIPYPDIPGFPMVPYLTQKDIAAGRGGNMIINCIFPGQFEGSLEILKASFEDSYPDSIKQKVLKNWQNYGFEE